jgi:hypothetical protein
MYLAAFVWRAGACQSVVHVLLCAVASWYLGTVVQIPLKRTTFLTHDDIKGGRVVIGRTQRNFVRQRGERNMTCL